MDSLLEVQRAVVHTFDGEKHEVHGGAYLSPAEYLRQSAEIERARQRLQDEETSRLVPMMVTGAALLGIAVGYWLGRRD